MNKKYVSLLIGSCTMCAANYAMEVAQKVVQNLTEKAIASYNSSAFLFPNTTLSNNASSVTNRNSSNLLFNLNTTEDFEYVPKDTKVDLRSEEDKQLDRDNANVFGEKDLKVPQDLNNIFTKVKLNVILDEIKGIFLKYYAQLSEEKSLSRSDLVDALKQVWDSELGSVTDFIYLFIRAIDVEAFHTNENRIVGKLPSITELVRNKAPYVGKEDIDTNENMTVEKLESIGDLIQEMMFYIDEKDEDTQESMASLYLDFTDTSIQYKANIYKAPVSTYDIKYNSKKVEALLIEMLGSEITNQLDQKFYNKKQVLSDKILLSVNSDIRAIVQGKLQLDMIEKLQASLSAFYQRKVKRWDKRRMNAWLKACDQFWKSRFGSLEGFAEFCDAVIDPTDTDIEWRKKLNKSVILAQEMADALHNKLQDKDLSESKRKKIRKTMESMEKKVSDAENKRLYSKKKIDAEIEKMDERDDFVQDFDRAQGELRTTQMYHKFRNTMFKAIRQIMQKEREKQLNQRKDIIGELLSKK